MQRGIFISFLLVIGIFSYAQKSHYDSIKKVLQEDSLEYEQDKKNADRIKQEADSMLNKELGHIERITPAEDTAAIKKKMRAIAALELQKRVDEERKNYYLFVGMFAVLVIAVIWLFKRKQFAEADKKKP